MDRVNSFICMLKTFGKDVLAENESKIVAILKDLQLSNIDVSVFTSILRVNRRSFQEFLGESDNNKIIQFASELSESTGYKFELILSIIEDFNHAWWFTQFVKPSSFDLNQKTGEVIDYCIGPAGMYAFYNEDDYSKPGYDIELTVRTDIYTPKAILLQDQEFEILGVDISQDYNDNVNHFVYIPETVLDITESIEVILGLESRHYTIIIDSDNPNLYLENNKVCYKE